MRLRPVVEYQQAAPALADCVLPSSCLRCPALALQTSSPTSGRSTGSSCRARWAAAKACQGAAGTALACRWGALGAHAQPVCKQAWVVRRLSGSQAPSSPLPLPRAPSPPAGSLQGGGAHHGCRGEEQDPPDLPVRPPRGLWAGHRRRQGGVRPPRGLWAGRSRRQGGRDVSNKGTRLAAAAERPRAAARRRGCRRLPPQHGRPRALGAVA